MVEEGLSRAAQSPGIVIATARSSIDDRIGGLAKGTDACLVKPIDVRELAATVVALNERRKSLRTASQLPPATPQWALIEGGWVLTDGIGRRLRLTTSEQRFLGRFNERGKTAERRALVEAIGADVYDFNYGHLDTIASRLRRRAEKSNMSLPLHTIRGSGFTFSD